jgi:protein-disulfide isomerase
MASSARFRPLAAEAQRSVAGQMHGSHRQLWQFVIVALAVVGTSIGAVVATTNSGQNGTAVERKVSSLLAGIPEHGEALGLPTAPVTLVFYGDLECNTTKAWVANNLPGIIRSYVRPGMMRIEFRAFKTDSHNQREFVAQQTAAIAAGAQNRLWPFIETFYYEQGPEYTPYVTERYLNGIAGQVPGLNLERWHRDREGGRRSEHIAEEDQSARAFGFHDTPSFQLGPTGGPLKDFIGRKIETFRYLHGGLEPPVSLIDKQDIATALNQLSAKGALHDSQSAAGHG